MNTLLDSLHNKILKSKFAEEVTEAEIDALVKAKFYDADSKILNTSEEFCEWRWGTGQYAHVHVQCEGEIVHIGGYRKLERCPYCNKKIKESVT